MELTLPNLDFTIPEHILELCWDIAELSDWKTIPNPREVALLDARYLDELFRWGKLIRFEKDYARRPAFMRGELPDVSEGLFKGMK